MTVGAEDKELEFVGGGAAGEDGVPIGFGGAGEFAAEDFGHALEAVAGAAGEEGVEAESELALEEGPAKGAEEEEIEEDAEEEAEGEG